MASVPWCKYFPLGPWLQLFIPEAGECESDATVAVHESQTIPLWLQTSIV